MSDDAASAQDASIETAGQKEKGAAPRGAADPIPPLAAQNVERSRFDLRPLHCGPPMCRLIDAVHCNHEWNEHPTYSSPGYIRFPGVGGGNSERRIQN